MSQKIFLFISLLLYTGCVERGYELTVNSNTNTITAIKSVDIRKQTTSTKADIDKMNTAVTKEQKKQPSIHQTIKKQDNELKKIDDNKKYMEEKKIQAQKQLEEKKLLEAKKVKAQQDKEERKALEEKLAQEKETKRLAAQKERAELQEKSRLAKEAAKKKEEALLQKIKEEKEKEAMEKKLALEKTQREAKEKKEKLALERKIEKEKQAQLLKETREKELLEKKIAAEKKALEKKRVAQLKKEEEAKKAETARLEKETKIRKEKEAEEQKKTLAKNKPLPTTETLSFKPSTQTYQKFGTSEIHGHVVYLTPAGQEISLKNTKIYLVPKNTKTDYWYNNYYLKNKEASSLSKNTVQYINATHLNLEKNFAFYGLATGTYYIIIESLYPASIAKNKKVYIAKKINVEKYKKIMTVFSKKL